MRLHDHVLQDEVLVGVGSDHEIILTHHLEAVALVEAPGAVIVDEDGQDQLPRATVGGLSKRPLSSSAMPRPCALLRR